MRKSVVLTLATALLMAGVSIGSAATLNVVGGSVKYNGGGGFKVANGSSEVAQGGRVLTGPNGEATIDYGGCTVRVGPSKSVPVTNAAVCQAGAPVQAPLGATDVIMVTALTAGAVAGIVALQKPASP